MKRYLLSFIILLFICSPSYAVNYFSDFENGIGTEWSPGNLPNEGNSNFTNFLGRLGNQTATLSLNGFGAGTHEVTLTFDFYAIDSWDGENPTWGWDYFNISGDYNASWTVDSSDYGDAFSFPYSVSETGYLGYGGWRDDIYRDISITFLHTGDALTLNFFGSGLQSIGDESWGLDNLSVTSAPVPEPATMFLFGIGLLGLAGVSRRKK